MKTTRPILPRDVAGSSAGQANKGSTSKITKEIRKRATMVGRACNACRKTKCKCDGARPTCKKCSERESECVYDTEEGMTRNATLQAQNEELAADAARVRRVLVELYQDHPTEVNRERLRLVRVSPTASVSAAITPSGPSSIPTDKNHSGPASYDDRLSQGLDEDIPMTTGDPSMLDQESTLFPEGKTNVNPIAETSSGADSSVGFYSTVTPNIDSAAAGSTHGNQYVSPNRAHMDSFGPCFPQDWDSYAEPHQSGPTHEEPPIPLFRQGPYPDEARDDWFRGGYDPNDGRISGRQFGWHFILVVRESLSIAPTSTSTEMLASEYREPYHRLAPLQSGAYEAPLGTTSLGVVQEAPESAIYLLNEQPLSYTTSQAASAHNGNFSPPPGAVTGYGNLPMSSALLANGYPPSTQRRQLLTLRVPEHAIPPLFVEEGSAMARMYVAFRDAALEVMGSGTPAPLILGDPDRVVVDVLLRGRLPSDPDNVDTWACQLMRALPEIDLYVQLAWVGLLTKFMRWILSPTMDNYAKVPAMMKPIVSQRLIPHSPALDLCPHPGMREALMQHYRDWVTPILLNTGSTMICWLPPFGVPIEYDPATQQQYLTASFENFTQNQASWSLGSGITRIFPEALEHGIGVRQASEDGDTGIEGYQRPNMSEPPEGMTSRDADEAKLMEEISALERMSLDLVKQRVIRSRKRGGGGGVRMEDVEGNGKGKKGDLLNGMSGND